jgi:hypothetical protein
MTTPLTKPLKRAITVGDRDYTVTIAPDGVKVVEKGKRKGNELSWEAIISGEASLAQDLRLSVDAMKLPDDF